MHIEYLTECILNLAGNVYVFYDSELALSDANVW